MYWTTTDDPSDGYSNHWSNAPETEDQKCFYCEGKLEFSHYKDGNEYMVCKECGRSQLKSN